jgi:nucleoside triphosphate pyrophosphatase
MRLILASASPRRAELLRAAGYTFEVIAADVDESIRPGEPPEAYVRRLAAEKSFRVGAGFGRPGAEQAPPLPERRRVQQVPALRNAGVILGIKSEDAAVPSGAREDAVILGADTTVVVNGEILGKPRDDEDARDMLQRLSGKAHQVLTGVSLRQGSFEVGRVETTSVVFLALTDEDISWYIASGEGRDKAGGYAIQGLAARFIPSIVGSYSNVVGLPVACVHELLRSLLAPAP